MEPIHNRGVQPQPADSNALTDRTSGTSAVLSQVSNQALGALSIAFGSLSVKAAQICGSYFGKGVLSNKDIERQETTEKFKNLEKQIALAEMEFGLSRKAYVAAKKETATAQVIAVQNNTQAYDKLIQILYQFNKLKNLDYTQFKMEELALSNGIDAANEQREILAKLLYKDTVLLFNALKEIFEPKNSDADRFVCSKAALFSNYEKLATDADQSSEHLRQKTTEENRLKREMETKNRILNSLLEEQESLQGKMVLRTPNFPLESREKQKIIVEELDPENLILEETPAESPLPILPQTNESLDHEYNPPLVPELLNSTKPPHEMFLLYQIHAGLSAKKS